MKLQGWIMQILTSTVMYRAEGLQYLDMPSLDEEEVFYLIALVVHHRLGRIHLLSQHHSQALNCGRRYTLKQGDLQTLSLLVTHHHTLGHASAANLARVVLMTSH